MILLNQNSQKKVFFGLIIILVVSYAVGFVVDEQTMVSLVTEDGIYENVGALSFFLAFVFFFLCYWNSTTGNDFFVLRSRRNIFYLLLAVLFLFICGEEISWGQRIFGLETPEAIRSNNIQKELNLHNLKIFNSVDEQNVKRPWYDIFSMSRLFRVFWFLFCIATPLLDRYSETISGLRRRLNIPLVPIWIGILFLINYGVSKVMEIVVSDEIRFVEIEEFNTAVLFAAIAFWLFQTDKKVQLNHPATSRIS